MKTAVLNSFLKFYVMRSTGIDLYGIAHVKVDYIPVLKMCVLLLLGRFVWTTIFAQCVKFSDVISFGYVIFTLKGTVVWRSGKCFHFSYPFWHQNIYPNQPKNFEFCLCFLHKDTGQIWNNFLKDLLIYYTIHCARGPIDYKEYKRFHQTT